MNKNFTHRELKTFTPGFSNFYTIHTSLPAAPWFAVNFLLVQYNHLLSLPAISKIFNDNNPALQLTPVVIDNLCNYKKSKSAFSIK